MDRLRLVFHYSVLQKCCGSGPGSVYFWASWIGIYRYFVRIRIDPSINKQKKVLNTFRSTIL